MKYSAKILIGIMSFYLLWSCDYEASSYTPGVSITIGGQSFPATNVTSDLNGDGVVDDDDVDMVTGGNVSVSYITDSEGNEVSALYGAGEEESEAIIGEKVEDGVRLCYGDSDYSCDTSGGLYSFETSVGADIEELIEGTEALADEDEDGVVDWVDVILNDSIAAIAEEYSETAYEIVEEVLNGIGEELVYVAGEAVMITDNSTGTSVQAVYADFIDTSALSISSIPESVLEEAIYEAIYKAIQEVVTETSETVDIQELEQAIQDNITDAVISLLEEYDVISLTSEAIASLPDGVTEEQIVSATETIIAQSAGDEIAEETTDTVSEIVAEEMIATIETYDIVEGVSKGEPAQGVCPEGYHIPTDAEWMSLEYNLGMSAGDLARYGEEVTDRGADVNIVQELIDQLNFDYDGYASINGTYAQQGEVGAFWSSSAGEDENGEYVWVREISIHYDGIIRYKHYEKSGLSVRCFAD